MPVTLIVFSATEDLLVVAADRRLTYPDKSIAENDRTKLLTWCGGLVFGFTGQALLTENRRPEPSLLWFARRIAEQEQAGVLDFPKIAAALDRQSFPAGSQRLAFGGMGFVNNKPTMALVTNMHDDEGSVLATRLPKFRAVLATFSGTLLRTLGGALSPAASDLVRTRLPVVRDDPSAVAEVLAGAIERSTSDYIGDQALVVTLQREPAPGSFLFDVVTPDLSRRPAVTVDFASPIFVCRGAIMQMPNQPARRAPKRK